jgi:hypothetical protein
MIFRLLEYLTQILRRQLREWLKKHPSVAGFRFQPVIPIVFYTGTQRWQSLGRLADLFVLGKQFADVIPVMKPLFLSLPALTQGQLQSQGGAFGQLLRLVQRRKAKAEEFEGLLEQVLQAVEKLAGSQRERWREFLSYVYALVYHERAEAETTQLHQTLEEVARAERLKREIRTMKQTYAEMLKAEGRKEGRKKGREEGKLLAKRESLLRLLRVRFENVPAKVEQAVNQTTDLAELNAWFDRAANAETLADVGITS